MGFHFNIGAMTDVGKAGTINEDCLCVDQHAGLFMVADGVGGLNAGEVASSMAVKIIQNHVFNHKAPLVGEYRDEFFHDTNRMLSGIRLANTAIYEAGQKNSEQRGMATTISSVYINGDVMALANVGDSRIYRLREGCLEQLTVDHSLVAEQLKYGLLTADEAAKSKYKNVITRAVGAEKTIRIDADEEVLFDHDRLLLCTDGLTNMVEEEDIARIILGVEDDPQKACEKLVDAANAKGGIDNITVILIHCRKDTPKASLLERAIVSIIDGLRKAYDGILDLLKPYE